MGLSRPAVSYRGGSYLARARFRRWFGGYYLAAVFVFALGVGLGVALVVATDLGGLSELVEDLDSMFPDRLTFWIILQNNLVAVGVTALGLVSFGLVAVVSLLLNGFVVGVVVAMAAREEMLLTALTLIVPHGLLELAAFWLIGALSFRVTHRFVNYLRGMDETPITRQELFEIGVLLGVAALAIVVAAWIEATVTMEIARWLVGPL